MKEENSCKDSIKKCLEKQYFSIAHLYKEEETLSIHINECYEIYYSISGGKQFLIDNKIYDINPGDLFVINQFESHYIYKIDKALHERIVISISPDFLKSISTSKTEINYCFKNRTESSNHKISLNKEQQNRFLYFINKITTVDGFGSDLIEYAAFLELMASINIMYINNNDLVTTNSSYKYNTQIEEIMSYINKNITESITIEDLASKFYLSPSYICRIFKIATGTTINKYILSRRISIAKSMLSNGSDSDINEVCEKCGFNDYSNFYKAFKKTVGISPKKYSKFSIS